MTHLVLLWVGIKIFQEGKSALKPPQGARGPLFLAYIQKPKTNAKKESVVLHPKIEYPWHRFLLALLYNLRLAF